MKQEKKEPHKNWKIPMRKKDEIGQNSTISILQGPWHSLKYFSEIQS